MSERYSLYAAGKAGAHVESLFDRHGSPGKYGQPDFRRPMDYYCGHITLESGERINVSGIDEKGHSFYGWFSRAECLKAVRRFQEKCAAIAKATGGAHGN